MVIQRWQSVLLFVAAVCVALGAWLPFGVGFNAGEELVLNGVNYPVVLILSVITALLYLVDIFLFGNLKLQQRVSTIAVWLNIVDFGLAAYFDIAARTAGYQMAFTTGIFTLFAGIVFALWAKNRIRHDDRLLRAADRLR